MKFFIFLKVPQIFTEDLKVTGNYNLSLLLIKQNYIEYLMWDAKERTSWVFFCESKFQKKATLSLHIECWIYSTILSTKPNLRWRMFTILSSFSSLIRIHLRLNPKSHALVHLKVWGTWTNIFMPIFSLSCQKRSIVNPLIQAAVCLSQSDIFHTEWGDFKIMNTEYKYFSRHYWKASTLLSQKILTAMFLTQSHILLTLQMLVVLYKSVKQVTQLKQS